MKGLIVISAPSGAGKSTLCTRLLREQGSKLRLSISTTSRTPRGNEVHGREYFFTNPEQFKIDIQNNRFAEWALVHDNYYGTEKATIEQCWSNQQHVLLDIDVQGAETLFKLYGDRCYRIFISPPNMVELEARLRSRGTDPEEIIQKRLKNAQTEMHRMTEFDQIIINDTLEDAYQKLQAIVLKVIQGWEQTDHG